MDTAITTIKTIGLILVLAGLAVAGCARKNFKSWNYIKDPALAAQLKSFVAAKEAQANAATNESRNDFPAFFAAAAQGDWPAVNR
ncbi:MAG: hypothetical protein ACREE6_16315, partial [Limisphaerales bacterium]